jgi:hypothetical protein
MTLFDVVYWKFAATSQREPLAGLSRDFLAAERGNSAVDTIVTYLNYFYCDSIGIMTE